MRKINALLLIAAFLTAIVFFNLHAEILNVPDEYDSIQDAIDDSDNGDTVLVQPGLYEENIDFDRHNIVVGSLYLTTENEAYIDSTIIDGQGNGPVVHFRRGESPEARFTGFTVQNGSGYASGNSTFGGAIQIWQNSNPTMDHLVVRRSTATFGAGMYCQDCNEINLSYIEVYDCTGTYGGGIRVLRGSANLDHISIHHNSAENSGGALHVVVEGSTDLVNITASNNQSARGGGLLIGYHSQVEMVNSIFFDNGRSNLYFFADTLDPSTMEITYSDIEGGEQGIELNNDGQLEWGDGNIDEDPLYEDPDHGDFHLTEDSPCINTGDPESPEDPDGSRADMGAYPFFSRNALLYGYVLDLTDDSPLEGAMVMTSNGQEAESNAEGYWMIDNAWTGDFTATASLIYFNDVTLDDLHLEMEDTLEVVFRLPHPEFAVSADIVRVDVPQDSVLDINYGILNAGSGPVNWTVETRFISDQFVDPWELRESLPVGQIVEDDQMHGVVFINDQYYVSGTNDEDPTMIYVFDRDGNMVRSFEQCGAFRVGMRDLAWDGNLIWGSGERTIFGFTTEGELRESFDGPFYPNTALTWDNDNELLWISSTVSAYIAAYNLNGEELTRVERHNFNIFGLAYWSDDPDGYQLYVFHSPGQDRQVIHKIDTEFDEIMHVADLEPESGGRPDGAFITRNYLAMNWVFMTVSNASAENGGDRIDVWQLSGNIEWMEADPIAGIVEAEGEEDIVLTFDASGLIMDMYEGEIIFNHNAIGDQVTIPIEMNVVHPESVKSDAVVVPDDFFLSDCHPNPFNSTTRIGYGLPHQAAVKIGIYNSNGRLLTTVIDDDVSAGCYSIEWNALNLTAGTYFIRMKAPDFQCVRKAVIIR